MTWQQESFIFFPLYPLLIFSSDFTELLDQVVSQSFSYFQLLFFFCELAANRYKPFLHILSPDHTLNIIIIKPLHHSTSMLAWL